VEIVLIHVMFVIAHSAFRALLLIMNVYIAVSALFLVMYVIRHSVYRPVL